MTSWLLGVDVGATGSRLALAEAGRPRERAPLSGPPAAVVDGQSTARQVLLDLIDRAEQEWPDAMRGISGFGAGIAGFATLVLDPDEIAGALQHRLGGAPVALAADMVTSHLGALGGEGGAVLAAGTGAIAFGTDHENTWHRVDGWGHLIGDLGSGAWIGIEALRAAAALADGRASDGGALLAVVMDAFGPVTNWPSQVYLRPDRAAVLASLVPSVADLAMRGDGIAAAILRSAASQVAATLAAALQEPIPARAAYTGGLFSLPESVFLEPFLAEFATRRPDIVPTPGLGTSLDGSLLLAHRATLGMGAPLVTLRAGRR
ncbi:BadF/BadG/BcrA/BcrD ATPase family protein [Leifsonia sp. H3M29-4]|uniref:N-acetylglucosamine kinase n=1 Tax=Salinibacterium metalliresistens TaxID=3031321 RepID=UPI0023DC6C5D|nr:BadF/BadG/BcrA/BcrD ATPase family protein [Salinibacterium metalliresistens]MDF1478278.1 BadF/BadG/BcrA/BcrD ATPase family protein [Salinibacterium metalliresistens]